MKNPDEILSALKKQPVKQIPCSKINIDDALQPRNQTVIPYPDRFRQDDATAAFIAELRLTLKISIATQLDAVCIAIVSGKLFLVDGHHRLKAYRLERREHIPARILEMTWEEAVLVTKLVNIGGARLPLHKEQTRECLWQYLAGVTQRGKLGMPSGLSTRILGGKFGMSHDTVSRMRQRLPQVNLEEIPSEFWDEGTKWPPWKYFKGSALKGMFEALPPDKRLHWKAERFATQLAKLLAKHDTDAIRLGIELLKQDSEDCRLDAIQSISNGPKSTEEIYLELS